MIRAWILVVSLAGVAQADQWLDEPVDDKTFEAYLEFFAVDEELPFETVTYGVEQKEGIRREHLSFQSTPGERVTAKY